MSHFSSQSRHWISSWTHLSSSQSPVSGAGACLITGPCSCQMLGRCELYSGLWASWALFTPARLLTTGAAPPGPPWLVTVSAGPVHSRLSPALQLCGPGHSHGGIPASDDMFGEIILYIHEIAQMYSSFRFPFYTNKISVYELICSKYLPMVYIGLRH